MDPRQTKPIQRRTHAHDGFLARLSPGHQLTDQRIVIRFHLHALIESRIEANAVSARELFDPHRATRRHEIPVWIFGINAAFDGVASERNILLRM